MRQCYFTIFFQIPLFLFIALLVLECYVVAVLERVKFRLAVLVHQALNGTALRYLSERVIGVSDMPSSSSSPLVALHNCWRPIVRYCGAQALE